MAVRHVQATTWLAEAYLLAGRADEALSVADSACRLAAERKERGNEAWAVRLLGEINSRTTPPQADTAETHYRRATTLASERNMRPLVAHTHLGLGRLHSRTGKASTAAAHLSAAAGQFAALGMALWSAAATAELARLR